MHAIVATAHFNDLCGVALLLAWENAVAVGFALPPACLPSARLLATLPPRSYARVRS
jgi:hypothetical protein